MMLTSVQPDEACSPVSALAFALASLHLHRFYVRILKICDMKTYSWADKIIWDKTNCRGKNKRWKKDKNWLQLYDFVKFWPFRASQHPSSRIHHHNGGGNLQRHTNILPSDSSGAALAAVLFAYLVWIEQRDRRSWSCNHRTCRNRVNNLLSVFH